MQNLIIIILIVFALLLGSILGYFIVGNICYRIALKRENIVGKRITKEMNKMLKRLKINYKWWKKVSLEKWTHTSADGLKLVARYLKNKSENKIAIVVHGYMTTYKEMQPYVKYFYSRGYSVLCTENRGHGESEGASAGMGWKDKDDVLDWIKIINEKFKGNLPQICVFGLSMGAATVCMLSGLKLPKNVKCLISDCAYDCVYDQFKYVAHNYLKLPEFPILPLYESYSKLVQGFSLKEADAKISLQKCKIPILFFHGDKDKFVDYENVTRLYNSAPENLREILIIEGADHAESYGKNTKLYTNKLDEFLEKNM